MISKLLKYSRKGGERELKSTLRWSRSNGSAQKLKTIGHGFDSFWFNQYHNLLIFCASSHHTYHLWLRDYSIEVFQHSLHTVMSMNLVTQHIFDRIGSLRRRSLPALLFLCPLFCWTSPWSRVTECNRVRRLLGCFRLGTYNQTRNRIYTLMCCEPDWAVITSEWTGA